MIFQRTAQWVLDRSPNTGKPKTQTRRLARDDDICVWSSNTPYGHSLLSVHRNHRLLYQVGKTYAVQVGRGVCATGYFRLLGIKYIEHTEDISGADANAEGFASQDAFREIWVKLYSRAALARPCYALVIERIGG